MKIALFTETYLPHINGVVTHVKVLKEGLEKLGHQVLIVCAEPKLSKHILKDGVLYCPGMSFKKFYNYGLALPISQDRYRYLKKFAPDIIHIHTEFGVGLSGAIMAKNMDIPLIYTLHTMYYDYLYYIVPKPLISIAKKTIRKYARFLVKRAAAITGPSKKVEEFIKELGIKKELHIFPNPVELDKFDKSLISEEEIGKVKQKFGFKENEMILCFCGRLGREKNVDTLLKYWQKTINPEDKIKLLIIGDGPSRKELSALADELKINNMVSFAGKVAHDEILPYYAACDLYITASLSDTNSISMLEAMATGLPVEHILDELNKGQVVHGKNGFIYNNEKEMYEQITAYRNKTKEEKEEMSKAVIDSVQNFGAETLANNLLSVYNPVVENYKKRPHKKKFLMTVK